MYKNLIIRIIRTCSLKIVLNFQKNIEEQSTLIYYDN